MAAREETGIKKERRRHLINIIKIINSHLYGNFVESNDR